MPFASPVNYSSQSRSLAGKNLASKDQTTFSPDSIKIDAILVFNDPRDWILDSQIILDLLLSHNGYLGTVSSRNNDSSLPNHGYQEDGQPPLYFSNPDLLWASDYHLPRLGQGGFKEAIEGIWEAMTGGSENGVELRARMFGKPHQGTYQFAERRLQAHRRKLIDHDGHDNSNDGLRRVYMIGGTSRNHPKLPTPAIRVP